MAKALLCPGWQTGGEADVAKYSKRTVRVTQQHNEECRRLLRLMGVPVIEVRMGHLWSYQRPG